MLNFLIVFADLFLSRLRGYYWLANKLSKLRYAYIPYAALPNRLNLGCSDTPLRGYLNADARVECNPDIVTNANQLPFPDNTFDLIRASHILEHFHPHQTEDVLREWLRVLKPGGYLVVCVPHHTRLSWRSILSPHNLPFPWVSGLFALDLPPEFRHQNVFTPHSLKRILQHVGFTSPCPLNWRCEDPARQFIFDNSCSPYSLNLSCQKPSS